MRRSIFGLALAIALILVTASPAAALPRVVVYVADQGLCYTSVVAPNSLPDEGPFQPLAPSDVCGSGTFMTGFGPGDPGYVGGRWLTGDGKRFSCPLVGPGYAPPR